MKRALLLLNILIIGSLYGKQQDHVSFNLKEEKLIDAVNRFAALKGVNLILPEKQDALQVKVNYSLDKSVTVDEAWQLLELILHMVQFSIVPRGDFHALVPGGDTLSSPLPLWVNVPPELLPNGSEIIRYLYSFVNLNIADKSGGAKTNLQRILKDMMPGPIDKVALFDENSNSIVLTGQASVIKSLMTLIKELDKSGFREAIDVIELKHASAGVIERIIKELVPSAESDSFRYPVGKQPGKGRATYFAKSTRLISLPNSNSLAIMGKIEAVDRLANFIRDYLDIPTESERTLLHVKHLNNLDAEVFAGELQGLLRRRVAGDQSRGKSPQDNLLKDVIVVPEKIQRADSKSALKDEFAESVGVKIKSSGDKTIPTSGGNNLIIAARETDWKLINDIITQLDRPKLQVALEVLIVDVKVIDTHVLGAQNRGVTDPCVDEQTAKWQTANLGQPVLEIDSDGNINNTAGLNANLGQPSPFTKDPTNNIAALATSGTTVLSFKDKNGIRTIIEALESYEYATILSQPFVVTSNHKSATIYVGENKRFDMGLDTASTGGPAVQNIQDLDAALAVGIQPHISTSGELGNVNLEIIVRSSEFSPTGDGSTRFTRTIRTNSNVKNHDVLVIGGLTRVTTRDTQTETPPLSRIPIIGSLFFKKRSRNYDRANLMVFISPTIINTRPTGGADSYTLRKQDQIVELLDKASENFEILNDPITHTFFQSEKKGINSDIDYFMGNANFTEGGYDAYIQALNSRTEELVKRHDDTKDTESEIATQKPVISATGPRGLKEAVEHKDNPFKAPGDEHSTIVTVQEQEPEPANPFKDKLNKSDNPFKTKKP